MHRSHFPSRGALACVAGALFLVLIVGCSGSLPGKRTLRLTYAIAVADDASSGARVTVSATGRLPHGFRLLLPPVGRRRELRVLEKEVGAPEDTPPALAYKVAAPVEPHGGPGFACYRGFELLAQPAGGLPADADSITLSFDLPEDHHVVAPLSALAEDTEAPARGPITISRADFQTLLESYIAIGDYGVRVLPPVAGKLPPIVWGRRRLGAASEGEMIALVQALLLAHVGQFGADRPHAPYSVVLDYPYEGHGFAGNATGRSIDLRMSRDVGVGGSPGLVRLTAHELAHFWLGGAFPFPRPEDHWFVEGAADYYGLRARVEAGYADPTVAGDELAEQWMSLSGNRWLTEPIEDLGRSFNNEPEAFMASYSRGCVTTWALDWRCKLAGRSSIAEVLKEQARRRDHVPMRELLIAHVRGKGWRPGMVGADGGADVAALLGHDPSDTFARVLAEAGLVIEKKPTRELTFGLERFEPGTTRLLAVTDGSPARSAGVRPGDRIREVDGYPVDDTVDLQHAMERSYARPSYKLEGMEVTYERAGTYERVRLFAAPQVVPILVDRMGERATEVLP